MDYWKWILVVAGLFKKVSKKRGGNGHRFKGLLFYENNYAKDAIACQCWEQFCTGQSHIDLA